MKEKQELIFDKIYNREGNEYCHMPQDLDYSYEFVMKAIKNGYNQGLKDASESVRVKQGWDDENDRWNYLGIDKQSILNLKIK